MCEVLCHDAIGLLLPEDALFQQLNPGLYTVCIVSNQNVSGQLIFTPTEVSSVDIVMTPL